MRRIAAVALTTATLIGGLALGSPANAATTSVPGVEATVVHQGTITGSALVAHSAPAGARSSACRWYERTEGLRTRGTHWHWLIYVKSRLTWCYDGLNVLSAKSSYTAYTYNKRVWRWRGWSWKSLTHSSSWATATTKAKAKFYYTGNRRTYQPYVIIQGDFDGSYHYWYGV